MLLTIELLFIVLLSTVLLISYKNEKVVSKNISPLAKVEEYWSGKERRQHFRFDKVLEVTYSVVKKPHLKSSGITVDISEGGMKLLLDDKLSKGAILDLKIMLPDSKKNAEVEGEVVWSDEVDGLDSSGKRLFHSGIRFLALKEPAGARLIDYVRSLASERERS